MEKRGLMAGRHTNDPRRAVKLSCSCRRASAVAELKDGKNQWSSALMVFGVRRSPPILWWPMRSGLTKLLWMATRSTGLNLSRRSKADTSFTASCCQPYPKKAQRTILAPAAINHCSKLMSAAQELFQLFIIHSKKPIPTRFASGRHCSAAKPE